MQQVFCPNPLFHPKRGSIFHVLCPKPNAHVFEYFGKLGFCGIDIMEIYLVKKYRIPEWIYHTELAPRSISRIYGKYRLPIFRASHQKCLEIDLKCSYRIIFSDLTELTSCLILYRTKESIIPNLESTFEFCNI
jgi:hypothetical protein